jgi:hypothetical protein
MGLVVTRRQWDSLLGAGSLPLVGAACYILVCWVCLTAWRAPLAGVLAVIAIAVTIVALLRWSEISAFITARLAKRALLPGALIFSLFYVLAYAIARPPSPTELLPVASAQDMDLITHAGYAKHVMLFGSPELDGASFDFRRSPAVTELLAGMAVFYRDDPLSTALPLRFAVVALVGLMTFVVGRSFFRLSTVSSMAIACVVSTSAYVNNIAAAYRLDALMAAPPLLHVVWTTWRARSDTPAAALAMSYACGYALLFFTVPATLLAGLAMQSMVIAARPVVHRALPRIAASAAIAISILAIAFHGQVKWSFAHFSWIEALAPICLVLAILIMGGITYIVSNADWLPRVVRGETDRRLTSALIAYVGIALMIANVAMHASARTRARAQIPAAWRNVQQLEQHNPRELTLKLTREPAGVLSGLTRYYLPSTVVHVIPPRARLGEFDAISRQSPLLIQNFGCEGVGHTDTLEVSGVGCVLLAPPSVTLDTVFPFNRTFLAVGFSNMSDRESGGRWSTGTTLPLALLADPERTPVDRDLHVNFLIDPFLPADVAPQRLAFTWGAEKKGMIAIEKSGWISLPVTSSDWSGDRVWRLPISINFPDQRRILFHELSISAIARGPLVHGATD